MFFFVWALCCRAEVRAAEPDWSERRLNPEDGYSNPYRLEAREFVASREAGVRHALVYPIETTGALLPYEPLRRAFSRMGSKLGSFDRVMQILGLPPYPSADATGIYRIPKPRELPDEARLGFTLRERYGAKGFTVSCAGCHSSELFGRTILGLQTRFPRANAFFVKGKRGTQILSPKFFDALTGSTPAEQKMYADTRASMQFVEARDPIALGLDTSAAHVGLSLATRMADSVERRELETLRRVPVESKPGTWWNVKYKNKYLLDGSVVAGNPIVVNLLWNEIGRGMELSDLIGWIERNERAVEELTTAVFATEAPRITDFFPAERIELARARRGQRLFQARCAGCHGEYEKAWDSPRASELSLVERLKTTRVRPPADTPVVDVGTDPHRQRAMEVLTPVLRKLEFSERFKLRFEPRKGYVPPPLVGVFARFPYFHNNSAPNLCAVLSPAVERPMVYYSGHPRDPDAHFDWDCVGYPTGEKTPADWKTRAHRYDTRKPGLSNAGHDWKLAPMERADLIEFLKTL